MTDKGSRGQRTKAAQRKNTKPVRRAKKAKTASVAVLILAGATALRRRKAAETLAETLQVELFQVDLSAVVSQYIGETEKNLNDVFDKAEAAGAILFFDQTDALFGTGSTVKNTHDRSANAETAHFLQRIEGHNGIVILTTNGTQRVDRIFSPQTPVVVMMGTIGAGRSKESDRRRLPLQK